MKRLSTYITVALGAIAAMVMILLVLMIAQAHSMRSMVKKEITALKSVPSFGPQRVFTLNDLDGLPEPVVRYFRYALAPGQEHIAWVSYQSSGRFKLPFSDKLFRIDAQECLSAIQPGLIFDARFHHCPFWGAWVHVRDKYAAKQGNMYGNLFSGWNIIDENNAPELNRDMFLRYIGHLTLLPTALLPNDRLHWEPIDAYSAKLVVADGPNAGSAIVTFNDVGEIVRWESDGRYDRLDGRYRKVKHVGYRSNYQTISGLKVPLDFKVEKILPDGRREVFWQGRISDLRFAHTAR